MHSNSAANASRELRRFGVVVDAIEDEAIEEPPYEAPSLRPLEDAARSKRVVMRASDGRRNKRQR